MSWTLAFVATATVVAGLAFARVGFALRSRGVGRLDDARAMRAFSLWWLAMGGSTICVAGMSFAGLATAPSVPVVATLRAASLVLLSIALTGLLAHVIYLYTGRDASRPISIAYAALTVAVIGHVLWSRPSSVDVTAWTVEIVGAREGLAISTALLIFAYLVPPIAAGVAYLRLLPRTTDPAQRTRLRVVGIGIVLWVSTHLLARTSEATAWQFTTRVGVGLAVAFAVWRVYTGGIPRLAETGFEERVRQLI